jgi:putative ABC transport system substrate-binding protein
VGELTVRTHVKRNGTLLVVTLALSVLLASRAADTQQVPKIPRIGVLATTSWPPFDSFRQGLRDLGYVEGRNLTIEYRWTEGKQGRYPALATQLVQGGVDIMVTWGEDATVAARNATRTIPIVMAAIGDAVETGFVTSLSRPGGNITGLSALNPELEGKRLQLLKDVVPKMTRVALLWNPTRALHQITVKETQRAAHLLGVELLSVEVPTYDLEAAFRQITKGRGDAVVVAPDPVFVHHRQRLATLATTHRLPAIYLHAEHARAGGLLAYGPNYHELFRRAAAYVDKILKGAKPADLPVEQPTRFELVVNLKTARALGLTIPQSILIRADQVIQ